jgi:hypothetical protein
LAVEAAQAITVARTKVAVVVAAAAPVSSRLQIQRISAAISRPLEPLNSRTS